MLLDKLEKAKKKYKKEKRTGHLVTCIECKEAMGKGS